MNFNKILDFYTYHALGWHILHYFGIMNTYCIALFVFIFGTILQMYHHGKKTDGTFRKKCIVLLHHIIPLLLIKPNDQDHSLIISLFFYLIYMRFDFEKIRYVYQNMYTYLYY